MVSIVTVNVSQLAAPYPSQLQRTGAAISQGGTLTAPGTVSYISEVADLTNLYNAGIVVTNAVWASGVATLTLASPHGVKVGDTVPAVIAGCVPTGYNGSFNITATTTTALTYPLAANPGALSTAGIFTLEDVSELCAMVTTFFAQGSSQGMYVLELGPGTVNEGVAALSAYIIANFNLPQPLPGSNQLPSRFYSFLVPREWDGNASFLSLLQSYQNPASKLYFFVTTTLATYGVYTSLNKCVVALIEAPAYSTWLANVFTAMSENGGVVTATTTTAHGVAVGQWFQVAGAVPTGYNGYWQAQAGTTGTTLVFNAPSGLGAITNEGTLVASTSTSAGIVSTAEFTLAAAWRQSLSYRPGATNKVTPFAFSYLYGVTPFPQKGNSALLVALKNAATNIVDTGAEGGISNTILKWGVTKDGNDFTYWYSIDWHAINIQLDVANAVILGSNDPLNPLYYNQEGINRVQSVIARRVNIGVTFGLGLFSATQTALDGPALDDALDDEDYVGYAVVNAIPFIPYSEENPSDYSLGLYSGYSVIYTPARGFTSIVVNLEATQFVTAT